MKFGLCTSLENSALAGRLGFDYLEAPLSAIASYTDEEFLAIAETIKAGSIRMERTNLLFPKTMRLIGPESSQKAMDEYLERAFSRMNVLGADVAVFGSGRSRNIPAEYPLHRGYAELIAVLKRTGEIAKAHKIMVAIEALNRDESNCINSLREGAVLQAAAACPAVGLLADLYHILKEGEDINTIKAVKDLSHTHIAVLEGRAYPLRLDKDIESFFAALREIGYDGSMSIEGKTENIEQDASEALALLRSLAQ
ncbi:sugar phosphate isomerase/epimerase [Treponema sp. OttesenSCG-928-L16]|nr:sugar phosphate isomerase/epimerase [Treponema sp. OttesenSCG-928-L16]